MKLRSSRELVGRDEGERMVGGRVSEKKRRD
jgi:hypothetical protein